MNFQFSRLFFNLFFIYMILKSVIVWSSDLDKIKKIEKGVSLNNLTFLDYNKTIIKIDNKKTDFFLINFWAS